MPTPNAQLFPHFPVSDCQHHRSAIDAAVKRVLDSGHYVLGEEVSAFEAEFAAFIGARHAVGVASGTDAIELMLRALDIGPGDKVIVPSLTATASAAGVRRAGAEVLLADCEADTLTLCPRSLEALLQSPEGQTVKAALAVHLYGQTADWEKLQRIAYAYGIVLLEDAAQAHGATWNGRMAGTLGKAAAFSFYPTKNLGALGDAGAVVTNEAAVAARLKALRQYGWHRRHISDETGVNSRLDEMQAAILRVKLTSLGEQTAKRRELAAFYTQQLSRAAVVTPPSVRATNEHAYHLYVVRAPRRDALMRYLIDAGIPVGLHYPAAVHQQPAYAAAALTPLPLSETTRAVEEILSLPLHPFLSQEAAETLCETVNRFQ
jgi:dTDP-4-amino-4,6-dideoxygalactose transaminase